MNVKGSIFIALVKMIRKEKGGAFDTYLTTKDLEIISQKILPSTWYPYETFKHCLEAIFAVTAKNDLEVAKEWGRFVCQAVMTTIYKTLMKGCDPSSYIKKYEVTHRNLYDFGKTEIIEEAKNRFIHKLSGFDDKFALLYYIHLGWIERGLELCGAKNVKSEFVSKSWEGQPFTSIRFTWT
jgi:hypothetical protein